MTLNILDAIIGALSILLIIIVFVLVARWFRWVITKTGDGYFFIRTKGSKYHVSKNPVPKKKYGEHEEMIGIGGNQ